jgi:hypothetical protein
MLDLIVGGISKVIDKIFPDKDKANQAKIELLRLEQEGQLKFLETQLSGIIAEAKSNDKWTSRARPSFLYVFYIMLIASFPMGILYAINPHIAHEIIIGMTDYFKAIPKIVYELFGVGYLGYVGGRSFDKWRKSKKGE